MCGMSDNPTPQQAPVKLAGNIRVYRNPGESNWFVDVDGQPFPWYLGEDAHMSMVPGDVPAVTVTIIAESVTVDDRMLLPAPRLAVVSDD